MDYITNEIQESVDMDVKNLSTQELHEIKLQIKALERLCKAKGVPFFLAYYTPKNGYTYSGLFPEEINSDHVTSEYWRFLDFLKIVVGFNREDYKPVIKSNKK